MLVHISLENNNIYKIIYASGRFVYVPMQIYEIKCQKHSENVYMKCMKKTEANNA